MPMPGLAYADGSAAFPQAPELHQFGKLLVARSDIFPQPPDPAKVNAMTQFALDRVGYPYSEQELRAIAFRILQADLGVQVTSRMDPKNQFICSEYVAKCYDAIGVELAASSMRSKKVDYHSFAPADIANDAHIRAVYSIWPF